MKRFNKKYIWLVLVTTFTAISFLSCSDNDENIDLNTMDSTALTTEDEDALLFMLEEEKLARDTYIYLGELWGNNQFLNIKESEQSHMNAVIQLLESYNIEYTTLSHGKFINEDIQALYDSFISSGSENMVAALGIGATIEDLDIVDLEDYLELTSNTAIITVFQNLQCGSRNHLRSFSSALESLGASYTPQYLSEEAYNAIINDTNERCGW